MKRSFNIVGHHMMYCLSVTPDVFVIRATYYVPLCQPHFCISFEFVHFLFCYCTSCTECFVRNCNVASGFIFFKCHIFRRRKLRGLIIFFFFFYFFGGDLLLKNQTVKGMVDWWFRFVWICERISSMIFESRENVFCALIEGFSLKIILGEIILWQHHYIVLYGNFYKF